MFRPMCPLFLLNHTGDRIHNINRACCWYFLHIWCDIFRQFYILLLIWCAHFSIHFLIFDFATTPYQSHIPRISPELVWSPYMVPCCILLIWCVWYADYVFKYFFTQMVWIQNTPYMSQLFIYTYMVYFFWSYNFFKQFTCTIVRIITHIWCILYLSHWNSSFECLFYFYQCLFFNDHTATFPTKWPFHYQN